MRIFSHFAAFAKISLVTLVLKLTITVNNGEVRVINPERVQTKVACQGETATLKCKNSSQAMVIYSALYGREEKGRTLCPFIKGNVDQSVIDVKDTNDTSTCPEKNVTLEIMKLCHTRKLCVMTPDENLFGNHCKGTYKILKIIYACEDKSIFNTNPTSYSTNSPTHATYIKPNTPRGTTLTKRKRVRTGNATNRKRKTLTTKAPKITKPKHTTAPLAPKGTSSSSSNEIPTKVPANSWRRTTKRHRKTVSNTVKPGPTVVSSGVSKPVTIPVTLTNVPVVATKRNKNIKTSITSTGLQITIQVNGTNYTLKPTTVPITVKTRVLQTTDKDQPTSGPARRVSSATAAVMEQQSQSVAAMGVAGSLYLWFLHMKENKSTYVTVFILSALGAAFIMVGGVACFVTLQKKKDFLKLDIMHKPRRFISLPKGGKTPNQNGNFPEKEAREPNEENATNGTLTYKGPEVVFSAQDVSNQVKKEFNIDRYSGMENGAVNKNEEGSIHVNPIFGTVNNNKPANGIINQNQSAMVEYDMVSSLPSTPVRVRTLSEPKYGTARRARANSTGNVSRNQDRNPIQEATYFSAEKVQLPQHLSAGNVSHQNRHAASQNQSPSKTLPRQRSATANDAYCHSPLRNPIQMDIGGDAISSGGTPYLMGSTYTSQVQAPSRSLPNSAVTNQFPLTSGSLNNRQQSKGKVSPNLPSKCPHQCSAGHAVKQIEPAVVTGRDGEPNHLGSPNSGTSAEAMNTGRGTPKLLPNTQTSSSVVMLSNTLNVPLVKESNLGTPTPYSSHRDTGKSSRKWIKDISSNGTVPNITSNPNFSNMSEDVRKKNNGARVGNLGSDNSGILQHKTILSETQEQDTSKGTLHAPSTGELLSPLDALPDGHANESSLRSSDQHSYNANSGTSLFSTSSPPPPEQATDSSDDDLYSIVAKGTYSSAVPDPHLRHTVGGKSDRKEQKNRNKHVYVVVVPSRDGSTAV